MRKLLNTLYVTTQGAWVARDGQTVVVRVEHEDRLRLPIHTLSSLVCFGNVAVTPPAMSLCAESGVAISFLTEHGRFLARVQGPVSGNVLLRREQYRRADDPVGCAALARAFVAGKIANARHVLRRAARENATNTAAVEAAAWASLAVREACSARRSAFSRSKWAMPIRWTASAGSKATRRGPILERSTI